ncbi:unnamed protein product [Thlaspi arvense]|uniref:Uncharacterized protein n=1 Tax=Thlaspi arvense TaxID=13288 RepID=A0AAU9RJI6_THLAR|nr:unnamed protein product [Thlaspi arvense]
MMGKARKHSRGKSSGFVPDYMQAVETMVEPDEFGYSRGIDSEIEEPPALKRSRFSLNGDSYGVAKEVLSLSKMSRSERKNLVRKLRMELEQVRDLRKKIACISLDTVLLSPYSDIHSCSDGSRRPPQENIATFVGTQGKKRRPVRNDKQRTKKGPSRHPESTRLDVSTSSTVASVMKECQRLLDRVWSHKLGFAFRNPVDPVLLNIPDYFTVIKHPMDLGTIRSRLRQDEYSSPLDFAADVRLTFSNSIAYNPPGNQYHKMARDLSTYFEARWKIIEKKIPVIEPPVIPLTSSASLESEIPVKVAPPRKKVAAVNESKLRVEPVKMVMTDDEKKKLSLDLEALEEEFPQNIVDILREQSGNDGQSGEAEIEIDIETLSDEILFMVRKLLDDYLMEKKKSQEKSEPCEMEIVHDSGFSNSPLQPSKGDLLIDEDVDIVGGNDPPVSSHPPLKIEKDAACRNNECSSSSSSSSESGSSSSDSDSCSSSGSETDSIKPSNPTGTEDKNEPGVGVNRKDVDINSEKIVVNDSLNELGQVEHDVGEKSTAMDAVHVLPEEETAPPERKISPDKRYRAALLKNRFADTIMKAREKALTKGEKGDPEKLRIEREEFEKRLREEKERLQAEAKAAKEAKRKADVEAAEIVRREREQEREAARQALQKMEKTVEINEGRRFMEDLEMLRATGAEGDQLPTFMEEMIPKCSEDMLGSFKMEGNSNPLEQLGLYMKMDEDEDDEEDQPHFRQGEVDEQSLDRQERHTLSPHGVEREDQLVSENEKLVSQEDEKSINQKEGEEQMENVPPLGPHREEGEDQLVSGSQGREEVVSQKVQDNENHEEEEIINQIEGKEQLENVLDKRNGVEDKGDEEAVVLNKGDEAEAEAVDKGEEEAVDMGEVETEAVDRAEQETEAVDKGEQEQETEFVDMAGQETEVVENGEREIEVVSEREQETEVVDKGEEEAVDMGEVETEVFDRAEQETEAVDKGEQEQETEFVDMAGQETEVVENGEREIEVVSEREQETEALEKGEEKTEVLDKRGEETEVVGKGEQEAQVLEDEVD